MKNFLFIFFAAIFYFCCLSAAFADANDYSNFGILSGIAEEEIEEKKEEEPAVFKPTLSNRLITEVAFDDNYKSDYSNFKSRQTNGKVRFFSNLNLSKNWAINTYIRGANQDQQTNLNLPPQGQDLFFEKFGVGVQELNLSYKNKNYAVLAGKFNLNFGTAWRWNRGLWVHQIANNYRQTQKLGVAGVLHLGDIKKTGQYNFGVSFFTNDSKYLDNTIISNNASPRKYEGTPGDTRTLESYLAFLDIDFNFGEKFGVEEKLTYHFSYLDLAVNGRDSPVTQSKIADQKGFAAGLNYQYPWLENLSFDGLFEYVRMRNVGGNSNISDNYLTANVVTKIYRNWLFVLGYSQNQEIVANQYGFDQSLSEISVGYEFGRNIFFDKLTIQTGYKNQRTDYKTSINRQNVFGVLVRAYKNF